MAFWLVLVRPSSHGHHGFLSPVASVTVATFLLGLHGTVSFLAFSFRHRIILKSLLATFALPAQLLAEETYLVS